MERKILYGILFIVFIFSIPCHAEQDAATIPEGMGELTELFKEYMDAWTENYKEMSKYHTPYYTYTNSIFKGVAYVPKPIESENIGLVFYCSNQLTTSVDVAKMGYFGVDGDRNIFRFEFLGIIDNEGIANSSIVNPKQEIVFECLAPFKSLDEIKHIQEIYIKWENKRIFFVPEGKINEYQKTENKILRHLRNLWWNIK